MLMAQQMLLGSSIITMPTADVAAPGEANIATYAVNFDGTIPTGDTAMDVHIAYAGIVKNLEIEANVYDYNNSGFKQDFLVATYKVLNEGQYRPQVSVGVKNPNGEILGVTDDPTYFIALVKTLAAPAPGEPFSPVVRLHLGLGDNVHRGVFGGLQMLVHPKVGLALLHDANDVLIALTATPIEKGPTLKAGTLGPNPWFGVHYDLRF